jgi:DnaJ family protein A protein 2
MELYSILGVTNTASQDEIKKAYRKLAIKEHPDKGGDPEKFKQISEAYSILQDPQKKQQYDCGMLDEHGNNNGPSFDPFHVFSHFFNNETFGQSSFTGKPAKSCKEVNLRISLEDIYKGKQTTLKLTKQACCQKCNGEGGHKPKNVCLGCGGGGKVRRVIQLAPGMVTQSIGECQLCNGLGVSIDPRYVCEICNGNQTCEEITHITIEIKKGTRDSDRIVLTGYGDYNVLTKTHDDLILVIKQKQHSKLKRNDNHLIFEQVINVRDSLTGCCFKYEHIDGKVYGLECQRVVHPGSVFKVKGMGMPISNRNSSYGDLYIKFNVLFPSSLVSPNKLLSEIMVTMNVTEGYFEKKYLEDANLPTDTNKSSQCSQQ